jgi:hypothetical protein
LGYALVVYLVIALGLVALLGLGVWLTASLVRPPRPPVPAALPAAPDAVRSILDALLVPALDRDAVPLRWVDPRPALRCGPNTEVRVNRQVLLAGALVPDTPFELDWQADGCRPFGERGPRFDGRVRLTVFREDWGFSAMIQPSASGLRVTSAQSSITCVRPGAAWLPRSARLDEPAPARAGASLSCQ